MILIITCRDDLTADYVIIELQNRGLRYFRLNTEDFPLRCQFVWHGFAPDDVEIRFGEGKTLRLADVKSVWYRRPKGPLGLDALPDEASRLFVAEEAASVLSNIWAAWLKPLWVSRPDSIRTAQNRILQLDLAARAGLSVPETVISNDRQVLDQFLDAHSGGVIGKTLHQQTGKTGNHYLVYTTEIDRTDLLDENLSAPLLLQEYVQKAREFRVTTVGSRVFSVALDSQSVPGARVDWRLAALDVPHSTYCLPRDIEDKLLYLVHQLGLEFAAIDLIQTPAGEIVFLELNPNGQWAWLQQMTGIPIREALIDHLALATNSQRPN